jgi:hypothetical protein
VDHRRALFRDQAAMICIFAPSKPSPVEALGGVEPGETPAPGSYHKVSLAFAW